MADIRHREQQSLCCQCGGSELLEVEEFIVPHELLRQFDSQLVVDCEGWSDELVEQYVTHNWRPFYYSNQHFRTRCTYCLHEEQQLLTRHAVDVSDDEHDEKHGDDERGPGVVWSSSVLRVGMIFKDRLWKRVLHRRATSKPLAPVRLRGRLMKQDEEKRREEEEKREEQQEDDREEEEETKKQYRVRPQLDDPTAISSDDDDEDEHDRDGQPRVGRDGHRTRDSVQLSQTGDETRYHFQAKPRLNNISDDSDDSDDEKKRSSAAVGHTGGDISDDSSESEERRARDSVLSVSQPHPFVRQYSDFGQHRPRAQPARQHATRRVCQR